MLPELPLCTYCSCFLVLYRKRRFYLITRAYFLHDFSPCRGHQPSITHSPTPPTYSPQVGVLAYHNGIIAVMAPLSRRIAKAYPCLLVCIFEFIPTPPPRLAGLKENLRRLCVSLKSESGAEYAFYDCYMSPWASFLRGLQGNCSFVSPLRPTVWLKSVVHVLIRAEGVALYRPHGHPIHNITTTSPSCSSVRLTSTNGRSCLIVPSRRRYPTRFPAPHPASATPRHTSSQLFAGGCSSGAPAHDRPKPVGANRDGLGDGGDARLQDGSLHRRGPRPR